MEKKFETRNTVSEGNMPRSIVMILFSIIEALLGFRFVFKLMGANAGNVFVSGVYNFTQFFVGIFEGIFSSATTGGAETEAVFEPATLIAIVVIGLIGWGIMKLMSQSTSRTSKQFSNSNARDEVPNRNTQNTSNDVRNNDVRNQNPNQNTQYTPNNNQNSEIRNENPNQNTQNTPSDVTNTEVNDDPNRIN